jgi:hypothetical protein
MVLTCALCLTRIKRNNLFPRPAAAASRTHGGEREREQRDLLAQSFRQQLIRTDFKIMVNCIMQILLLLPRGISESRAKVVCAS